LPWKQAKKLLPGSDGRGERGLWGFDIDNLTVGGLA